MFWHEITGRLEGMLLESKGSWAEAEKAYSSLLEENPFDQVSLSAQFLWNHTFIFAGIGFIFSFK